MEERGIRTDCRGPRKPRLSEFLPVTTMSYEMECFHDPIFAALHSIRMLAQTLPACQQSGKRASLLPVIEYNCPSPNERERHESVCMDSSRRQLRSIITAVADV